MHGVRKGPGRGLIQIDTASTVYDVLQRFS